MRALPDQVSKPHLREYLIRLSSSRRDMTIVPDQVIRNCPLDNLDIILLHDQVMRTVPDQVPKLHWRLYLIRLSTLTLTLPAFDDVDS